MPEGLLIELAESLLLLYVFTISSVAIMHNIIQKEEEEEKGRNEEDNL